MSSACRVPISIMREQCDYLSAAGFSATYIGQYRDDEKAVLNGDFQFVYTSPENIQGLFLLCTFNYSKGFSRKYL